LDFKSNEKLASAVQEAALAAGAEQAECIVRRIHSLRIEIRDGRLDGVQRREETSAALRVLTGGREGLAFSTTSGENLHALLPRDALNAARVMPSLAENRFSESRVRGPSGGLYDQTGLDLSFEDKVALAKQVEEAVLVTDGKVQQAHKPSYHEQSRETVVASGGYIWSYQDSVFLLSVEAISRSDGESQSAYEYRVSRKLSDIDPAIVGSTAAREALDLLGGERPPTGTFPAVFPPKVTMDLLAALVSSFSAEEMIKKRSRLEGLRDEKVFSECLTLVDDGTLPWRTGSAPFDDERVPPVPRKLVDAGVIVGCFHNLKTSALLSEEATGNGFRSTMTSAPVPGPSNLFVQKGSCPVDSLIPPGRAVRFSNLMGAHTIDRISGDFSLGASGHLLEGGELVRPFRNGTVSGNLFEIMASLDAVGDDLTFYGSMGSPTLLFGSVILSGS
jgi:PmbA protein